MRHYNERDNSGLASLFGLFAVLAAGALVVWWSFPSMSIDLSGVTQIGPYLGVFSNSKVDHPPAIGAGSGVATAPPSAAANAAAGSAPAAAAQTALPTCSAGQAPALAPMFKDLSTALGPQVGAPTACAQVNAANGDILQQTSSGLLVYRPSLGIAMFTNGWRHWALTNGQVTTWDGTSTTPPAAGG